MIFIALGTQDLPFNRILMKVDELIECGIIKDDIYAQIGYSTYTPKYFEYEKMSSFEVFEDRLKKCDVFISHGGTGSLVGALKLDKKIIAIPRLKKYGEHVDDHQIQIISVFSEANLLLSIKEVDELESTLEKIKKFTPQKFVSNKTNMIQILEDFIESI